jgi:hypothetical protein
MMDAFNLVGSLRKRPAMPRNGDILAAPERRALAVGAMS